MGSCSFRDFEEVCRRLSLTKIKKTNGDMWKGIDAKGQPILCTVHKHASGRDINDRTFHEMIKQLGFKDESDFKDFLNNKKRVR